MKTPMRRARVKVCGITRLSDAMALDELGVDYLGFNFHPQSRRFIEPAAAAEIIRTLKHAEPVGVFVNASPERISDIAAATRIRWAQLHGQEGWEALDRISLPVIKAIPHTGLADYGGLRAGWEKHSAHPRYFLVDTRANSGFGGSGEVFDWSLIQAHPLPRPIFLAGGLGPENLAAALVSKPFAVDLNSKVESAPGVKDIGLVERCLKILEAA